MAARIVGAAILWAMASALSAAEAAPASFDHSADRAARTENCETCHQFPATRTHVTGVRPTLSVPATYPLGPNGDLTCRTCHDITASPTNGASLLREGLQGATLCRTCHVIGAEDGSRLAHAVRVGAAHRTSSRFDNLNRVSKSAASASRDCQGCHDGVIGEDGHWSAAGAIGRGGRGLGHPVDVDYPIAQTPSVALTAVSLLNPAFVLERGRVGCTACHDALSDKASQLVLDNGGSALCLACHRM
jgi:predicted CXXCH cytochrome family protein